MNSSSANISLLERLQSALNQPSVVLRCQEISHLLPEISTKDGSFVLRTIVESIFGMCDENTSGLQNNGGGWGLRIITLPEHHLEFHSLRNFLSPSGPLLNFIYRLLNEPVQTLPFSLTWLPAKIRTEIQDGTPGPFYASKLQYFGQGKHADHLLFNSFEYYIFHFGIYLLGNGNHRWTIYWPSIKESLYPTLLEDYLTAYLPCDADLPPGPSTAPVSSPRGILSPISQKLFYVDHAYHSLQYYNPSVSPVSSRIYDYNQSVDIANTGGSSTSYHSSTSHHASYIEMNVWTSQTMIQILMEVWVNICFSSSTLCSSNMSPMQVSKIVSHPPMDNMFVPDCDHVRAVRMIIKHFHYFSNSLKPGQSTLLDPMRKNIWPVYRKSIYCFIKHLFIHWPLDSSFRLVLETWLSQIQPWRYCTYSFSERNQNVEVKDSEYQKAVSFKWRIYIAENLLFFSNFFRMLLKRLLKLDLSSAKNAQLLFRVTKVLSQENLMTMIHEIESSIDFGVLQKSSYFMGNFMSTSPTPQKCMQGQHSPQTIAQLVKSNMIEIEKSNFHYTPIFGEETISEVNCLVNLSKNTVENLKIELMTTEGNVKAKERKAYSWLTDFIHSLFHDRDYLDMENPREEIKKSIFYLDHSITHLCNLFSVSLPEVSQDFSSYNKYKSSSNESSLGVSERFKSPDETWTEHGLTLTNLGRCQLLNGFRRLDVKYEGHPDLKPITSAEIAILVKMFYHLCSFLNKKYESKLTELYHRNDYIGKLSHLVLCPPTTFYENMKYENVGGGGNPYERVAKSLPPRINLRSAAHKKSLCLVFTFFALCWLLGVSFVDATLFFLIPFSLFYFIAKATFTEFYRHSLQQ